MSEPSSLLRIRVQHSPRDPDVLHFVLDAPVQDGAATASFDGPAASAPLSVALFAVAGVYQVAVEGASIHVRKNAAARWEDMKAPIAAAIRATLSAAGRPLGETPVRTGGGDRDAQMLATVRDLLDSRINPSIASHGGRITAEHVTDAKLYLRMSGGCQGCAASQLTLRGGVERILRANLPDLQEIVDLTDHHTGATPFYRNGTSPDARSPLARSTSGRGPAGSAPAPSGEVHSEDAAPMVGLVRRYLEALPPSAPVISYGKLARALGLYLPGSVRRVTRALEATMHEDARAGRSFIAARAVSRASDGLPGKGFFDLARELARGPRDGETEREFHARELARCDARNSSDGKPVQSARPNVV